MKYLVRIAIMSMIACYVPVNSFAGKIYLSAKGSDSNTGISSETAVKTISKALSIAKNKDIIYVDGFININEEPKNGDKYTVIGKNDGATLEYEGITYRTWNPHNGTNGVQIQNKSVTIQGLDKATCGFDGNGSSTIFRVEGTNGIDFRNLTFKGGNSAPRDDAGAGLYIRTCTDVEIENCDFIGNRNIGKGNAGGGVVVVAANVNFKQCSFSNNFNNEGSAIAVWGGKVNVVGCTIEKNDASRGAILISPVGNDVVLQVKETIFKNNKATESGAAVYIKDTQTNKSIARFESCAFIGNVADKKGGAVYVQNVKTEASTNVSIINSTFYANKTANGEGAAIQLNNAHGGSKINIVNCTLTGNQSAIGGAINFAAQAGAATKVISNSIVENNTVKDGSFSDLTVDVTEGNNLSIANSFIGISSVDAKNYPGNEIGYYTSDAKSKAGFATPIEKYIESQRSIPLTPKSLAATFGDPKYLNEVRVTIDQLGKIRALETKKCAIGSVETNIKTE